MRFDIGMQQQAYSMDAGSKDIAAGRDVLLDDAGQRDVVGLSVHSRQASRHIARSAATPAVSVVVALEPDVEPAPLMALYRSGLDTLDMAYEVICLFGPNSAMQRLALETISKEWPELQLWPQRPWRGEDAALAVGAQNARAPLVMTLPGWPESEPEDFRKLLDAIAQQDMVIADRVERRSSMLQRARRSILAHVIRGLFGHRFSDLFSRTRIARREVLLRAAEFGVRQHFLPLLAVSDGYRVSEVPVRNPKLPDGVKAPYVFKPLAHVSALFDVMSLYVVLKFLRRPLRFFGAIGLPLILIGGAVTAFMLLERLFFGEALSDRPALIFSVMMIVLGVQITALGLIGEIVIFSASRRMKTYDVATVIRNGRVEAGDGDRADTRTGG